MDRRRFSRAIVVGAAALSAAACAQQQPKVAAVSQSTSFAYTSADRECMARAMYFESNRSSSDGMLAVGTIVANRVQSGRYGRTVCDVVATRGQFAPGVMTRTMSGPSAELARASADQVLSGKRHQGVKSAMHFHTAGMRFRYPNMHYVLVAGGNAFYEKRDSSGGGRAANARSLALALAVGRADPMKSHAIEVAAATPLEAPIAQAASSVTVTAKSGVSPAPVVVTQVAAASPAVVPAPKAAQPVAVAAVQPPRSQTQPVLQVAAAQPAVRPAAVQPQRVAAVKAAPAAEQPVAYAQTDAPAIALPKVKPAPKRTISATSEPMLASVAPSKPAHKPASAAPAVETKSVAAVAAPVETPAPAANPARTAASGYVASAFAAFE